MEEYYNSTDGSHAGSGGGDPYSMIGASSAYVTRRRRLSQQFSANAYLGHAFNACAGASPHSSSSGSVDVDPSLLRYTRPRLFSSSSSSSDERPLHLRQLLHLRSPLGSSSASPLSPMGRARTPPQRSPPVYCTPARGAVMEDGVLVINDGLQEDNRVGAATAGRLLDFGSYPAASSYGGGNNSRSNNIRSSGGSGGFYRMERRRSFEEVGYAMETPQMGWQASSYHSQHGNRNYTLPSASPVESVALPGMPATTHPAMAAAALRDGGFRFEVGRQVNRHISVPGAPRGREEGGPAPGAMAMKGPAGGTGMPTKPAVPDVWRRTEEEEEKLYNILYGPIPPPPPPSASTFVWPPTEEEEAEIERVLYGPRRWKRLPVFELICPED